MWDLYIFFSLQAANAENTVDTMTVGTLLTEKTSAASIILNDVVLWERAFRPHERHMLLGMKRKCDERSHTQLCLSRIIA